VAQRVNDQILAAVVLLIRADGKSAGQVPLQTALDEARAAQLDAVEVNAAANPPVVKLLDLKAYVAEKKQVEAARKPAAEMGALKEVTLGTGIQENDFALKLRRAREFLLQKHPVKVVVKFKRSTSIAPADRPAMAKDILARANESLADVMVPNRTTGKDTQGDASRVFYPKL
jgi:translation initiation factor IF-3